MKSLYTDLRHIKGMLAGAAAIAKGIEKGEADIDGLLDLLEAAEGKAEETLCDIGEHIAKSETKAPE
ncbi:MAG: hypothetical protein ACRCXB_22890 [Aeromonadaceae bacterium]